MKSSDCFNCHAVEQQVVGPAFLAIAEKYRNEPGGLDASVRRVREGSTGIWGQVPMLPHPQHTTDEVTIMLRWVFGLEKGKGVPSLVRGLTGEAIPPNSDKPGRFVLEANYTDAGRAPAGALTGSAHVALRSRRLEAEREEVHGATTMGTAIGSINHGHYVKFANVNLAEVGAIRARASSGNVGGTIEFRSGSVTGPLLGSVEVPNTGGWDKWIEPQSKLDADAKRTRTDVFAVFVNPGKGGLMNMDWVQFEPLQAATPDRN
jgi:cytochrome c